MQKPDGNRANGFTRSFTKLYKLQLLKGLLWLGVVAPNRVLFMGQIEVNCVI